MGLVQFIAKQFIDIIEWTESDDEVLAWRFPTADLEIQQGAQLIVRETQTALFVDGGRVADCFGPGRHTIQTANLPLLTDLRHWDKLFASPFKSEVYFFSTRRRVGRTWGTPQALTVRDREFGAVRVRAFGVHSFRVADAARFHRQVSGTRPAYTVADLEQQLRAILVAALAEHLGQSGVPFLDMAANQPALAEGVRARANTQCDPLGIAVDDVQIQSFSLPAELQRRLDERIGMGMVGELGRYTRFQTARAIPLAASEGGAGAAGAGVGMGAGIAMGHAMAQSLAGSEAGLPGAGAPPSPAAVPATPSPDPAAGSIVCARCQTRLQRVSRFCPECGHALA